MAAPDLEPHCGSWIAVCLTSGKPLFETFDRSTADKASESSSVIVYTAAQWLAMQNEGNA